MRRRFRTVAASAIAAALLSGWLGCKGPATAEPNPDEASPLPALPTDLWEDVTEATLDPESDWTNHVELADINGDGRVDILASVGGTHDDPEPPQFSRVYLNQGPGQKFREVAKEIFGPKELGIARVMKVRDMNRDGFPDIVVGLAFEAQSRLYLGDGKGNFRDVTDTNLPRRKAGTEDLDIGDVDGDGDLDMALVDWGPGNPKQNTGGITMLWLNDGQGVFTDATDTQMPQIQVGFSWEIDFVDVDHDYDLDLLVSAWKSQTSYFFENDGSGKFTDATEGRLPRYANNFEFEAIDLDGDTYLDVMTINDGEVLLLPQSPASQHVFLNDGGKRFVDKTPELWPPSENPPYDDNMIVYLDYDSDGDADALVACLTGPDRLLINDGRGRLRQAPGVFPNQGMTIPEGIYPVMYKGKPLFGGTLYISLADLNGDHRLDAVFAHGEAKNLIPFGGFQDKIYFGTANLAPDTAPPIISIVEKLSGGSGRLVRARVHDNKSPTMPHDWKAVALRWKSAEAEKEEPMLWYGEYLWRAAISPEATGEVIYQVCATDAAGNDACSPEEKAVLN
ncbi:MAG: FG-GAP repeat domain-containing protein [Vicinamibacteria bacterium]